MRVGVFHPGSQNAWQRAYAFQEVGQLGWFATSAYFQPDHAPVRLAATVPGAAGYRLRRQLLKRWFPPLDPARVRRMGSIEFGELALRRLGLSDAAGRINRWGNRRFAAPVIELLRREPVDVVWGYNSSSLEVFEWAKRQGLTCVLDQSIGHPAAENAVLLAERDRHPAFFPPDFAGHDNAWIARNDAELALADRVIVGSAAAARTLTERGVPGRKIHVVPYGYDETVFPPPAERPPVRNRPLSVLFVGTVGARKGMAYLLPAAARLPASIARITLVGRLDMPTTTFARYAQYVHHVPQIARADVLRHFQAADLFVFPSLFEGGGIVLAEALGAGLGILQGPESGVGARDGVDGRVMPRLDAAALADAIADIARNPAELVAWQAAAREAAAGRRWANFRAGLRGAMAS